MDKQESNLSQKKNNQKAKNRYDKDMNEGSWVRSTFTKCAVNWPNRECVNDIEITFQLANQVE